MLINIIICHTSGNIILNEPIFHIQYWFDKSNNDKEQHVYTFNMIPCIFFVESNYHLIDYCFGQ